ncbi:unnamed protein product [Lactuca saligna]|uniref:Uncharacterized protein n=1 Tax=Lactuca saligna TaxID=75948 RepID=A0AA35ZDW9_LACSI|nr:unnamed protein product [Lactuca saligna]
MIANGHSMGGLCIGPGWALAPCLISKASDKKSKSICISRSYPVPPPSSLVATSLPCSVAARWSCHSPPQQLSPEIRCNIINSGGDNGWRSCRLSVWHRNLGIKCCLHELANKSRISLTGASKMLANILYSYRGMGFSVGAMIAG